jgi:cell wall-associated NlpC family hydrolase
MARRTTSPRTRRPQLVVAVVAVTAIVGSPAAGLLDRAAVASSKTHARRVAALDAENLRLAAHAIEAQALATGALAAPIRSASPAVVIFRTDQALITAARHRDPARRPVDTRAVMGAVPYNLSHLMSHRPGHARRYKTRTLHRFRHAVFVRGAYGVGNHDGARVAAFQRPDGMYVDPRLPRLPAGSTIAMVALRAAMREIGQPYVWGGAGPLTFDCSGLVMRAYARAGVRLDHYTGSQWNEGRLIRGRDALPGDLILFGNPVFHVGMYLGAGWMLNAPFTGHYVDVVPVEQHVAGVIRP